MKYLLNCGYPCAAKSSKDNNHIWHVLEDRKHAALAGIYTIMLKKNEKELRLYHADHNPQFTSTQYCLMVSVMKQFIVPFRN